MKILIAAGGTGGHVYPALTIGNTFRRNGWDVVFVGRKGSFEENIYLSSNFKVRNVRSSLLDFSFISMLKFSSNMLFGISDAFKVLKSEMPDAVLGGGGYVSAPLLLAAHFLRVPYFIYEQNIVPGRTNRIFSKYARTVFTGFPDVYGFFNQNKTVFSGNPVRDELFKVSREEGLKYFGFSSEIPVLLVFGGSGGARTINRIFSQIYERLSETLQVQVIFITGKRDFKEISKIIKGERLRLLPYLNKMEFAYASADFALSRAGAMTLTELALTKTFGIVIPFPFARDNHQLKNALYLKKKGCVDVIEENNLSETTLLNKLVYYLHDTNIIDRIKCREAFPLNSAEIIYNTITEKING